MSPNEANTLNLYLDPPCFQALVRAVVLSAMSAVSLVANVAAIAAIARDRHRTSLCTMILHLSVADLFVSCFCLGGEAVWTYTVAWNAGNIMCKFVKYWQVSELSPHRQK